MSSYNFLKQLLFQLDAEAAHEFVMKCLHLNPQLLKFYHREIDPRLSVQTHHQLFRSPFGLAAGLDKNAEGLKAWNYLPLGAVEIGTITFKPQLGNEKPRVFRFPKQKNIINAMGFPSLGLEAVLKNLHETHQYTLGINIGKNKDSNPQKAIEEYRILSEKCEPFGDYLVINLSSPNTPHLRDLQNEQFLKELREQLHHIQKPIYIKISPDLSENQCLDLVDSIIKLKFHGIIATNTTKDHQMDRGGLSGHDLYLKSTYIRKLVLQKLQSTSLDFIGVGGFSHFHQVLDFWQQGGKVLQIYTHFIFDGPRVFHQWNSLTSKLVQYSGKPNLMECFKDPEIFQSFKTKLKD